MLVKNIKICLLSSPEVVCVYFFYTNPLISCDCMSKKLVSRPVFKAQKNTSFDHIFSNKMRQSIVINTNGTIFIISNHTANQIIPFQRDIDIKMAHPFLFSAKFAPLPNNELFSLFGILRCFKTSLSR